MLRPTVVTVLLLLAACGAADAAKKPKERQVDARAATGTLPRVDPVGRLRSNERSVLLRIRTASDASVEALFQVFCFDKQLRLKRFQRTVRGKGLVRSRPAPASGMLKPVRVGAVLYARR